MALRRMSPVASCAALLSVAVGLAGCSRAPEGGSAAPTAGRGSAAAVSTSFLPALPDGVAELKFADFYRMPVGPRGLEYTERLLSLRGKKVRVLGYMVRQSLPSPRTLLLSPRPMTLHEDEYGFCDDLPPQLLHVLTPETESPDVPFTPGVLLLTGRLDLGPRQEPDGRVSHVRLFLDPPASKAGTRG